MRCYQLVLSPLKYALFGPACGCRFHPPARPTLAKPFSGTDSFMFSARPAPHPTLHPWHRQFGPVPNLKCLLTRRDCTTFQTTSLMDKKNTFLGSSSSLEAFSSCFGKAHNSATSRSKRPTRAAVRQGCTAVDPASQTRPEATPMLDLMTGISNRRKPRGAGGIYRPGACT